MSPDKFFEVAFLVCCVALVMNIMEDGASWVRKEQPAQFFMFFVDAGDGFFEMAIDRVGLKML